MAFVHGKATKVYLGAYDATTYLREATASNDMDMAETSAFGNTYKTFVQGLGNSTINVSGMFDGASNAIDAIFNAQFVAATFGVTQPVTIAEGGLLLGSPCRSIGAQVSSYEITGSISDVVAVSGNFQSVVNSGARRGQQLLIPTTAISSTGNQVGQGTWGTALGSAAATTNGGYGVLHLVTNDRNAGSVVFKIQHSSDTTNGSDGVWADLVTFTSIGFGTAGAEYIQVASGTTVNKGLRATATVTGGASGAYYAFISFTRL